MMAPYAALSHKRNSLALQEKQKIIPEKSHRWDSQLVELHERLTHSIRNWAALSEFPPRKPLQCEVIVAERIRAAMIKIRESCDIDAEIRGGIPVLKGTRIPISQIVAELAENSRVSEIADELEMDKNTIVRFLEGFAEYLNRPYFR